MEQDTNAEIVENGSESELNGFADGLMEEIEEPENTTSEPEQTPETAPKTESEGDTKLEEPAEGKPEEGEPEAAPTEAAPPALEVTYLGEKKALTHDEAVTYAQKGMNYDRVAQKVSRLEAELATPTLPPVIEAYAKLMGGDASGLLAQMKAKVEEMGGIVPMKAESTYFRDKAVDDWKDFMTAYPDIKDPKTDLPQEVWDGINAGLTPRQALIEYRARDFETKLSAKDKEIADLTAAKDAEIASLKRQLEIKNLNETNKAKASGSLSTAGSGGDGFLSGFFGE